MLGLQLTMFAMAGIGAWLILTDFVLFPSLRTEKLYRKGVDKKSGSWMDKLSDPLSKRLEPYMLMSDYKKERLTHTLRTVGDKHDAVQYAAQAAAQAVILAAFGLLTAALNPLLPLAVIVLALVGYFKTMKEPEKLLKIKRERIELELPRFASTISNSLSVSRDIVKLMENYRKVCGPELSDELNVTLADMKTGNAQVALSGLENRIGSTKLSELVRGLLSVLRGEDQVLYFYTKNIEFRREYIEHRKQEIQKRPSKLTPYVVGVVGIFVVLMLYVLAYQVINNNVF